MLPDPDVNDPELPCPDCRALCLASHADVTGHCPVCVEAAVDQAEADDAEEADLVAVADARRHVEGCRGGELDRLVHTQAVTE